MRAVPIAAALAGFLILTGCDLFTGPKGGQRLPPLTGLPRTLSIAEQEVIGASNRFAFELLRDVADRDPAPNILLSPLSASMALGMTMNGASGETFEAMSSTLGFGTLDRNSINASYRSLIDLLAGLDRSVDMKIANSIWVREGFPLHDEFVQSSGTHFDAEVTALDFADTRAPETINRWVDRSTNGRIKDIVEEIAPDVMLYLINAIYFKGNWTTRFDRAATMDAPFHREDGSQQSVKMMHLPDGNVSYLETPEVQILDLPYGREAFSMTLVLPAHGRSVDDLVSTLDAERWNTWTAQLKPAKVAVYLPRFRLEYEKVLNETLRSLGMETAFSRNDADFSGMSPLGDDLYISNVKQKTFVDVNEEGTEAAAATSVEMSLVSAGPMFRADRPFLLAIRERFSGTIVFLGVIGAPPSE